MDIRKMNVGVNGTLARDTLAWTEKLLCACGPRLTGSESCLRSADLIEEELARHCDRTAREEFSVHPASFLFFMKYYAVSYAAAVALFFAGGPLVFAAAALLTAGTVLSLTQFVFYRSLFDPLFGKRKAVNVVGIIEPRETPRQQIIVSGHHDSPHEFTFLASRWQKWYSVRITAGVAAYVATNVLALDWAGLRLLAGADPTWSGILAWAALAGAAFVVPLYFFEGPRGVPGAGDNLIACAMAARVAEIFGQAGKNGRPLLSHTRIVAASFDAEECGLRGARAFVKKHRQDLAELPTTVLNMDSIYRLDELKFLTSDVNGLVPLSADLARTCQKVARGLGYESRTVPMVFGGGATDAAEFARAGIPSTTLLAMSTNHIREGLAYHTMNDTPDCIEPKAVEASILIACGLILQMDKEASRLE